MRLKALQIPYWFINWASNSNKQQLITVITSNNSKILPKLLVQISLKLNNPEPKEKINTKILLIQKRHFLNLT